MTRSTDFNETLDKLLNGRRYASGQNSMSSPACIATHTNGTRCMAPKASPNVPYCATCMKKGDPSLGVVKHPRFGKMLVANRDLPDKYYMGLFGQIQVRGEMCRADDEWGFETADGTSINPVKFPGAQVQYSQCPGPHEKVNLNWAKPHCFIDVENRDQDPHGSMMFTTTKPVKKNFQLMMMYSENQTMANEFFEERGLTRCDVYTKKYPTEMRASYGISDLLLRPQDKAKTPEQKKISNHRILGLTIGARHAGVNYGKKVSAMKSKAKGSKTVSMKKSLAKKNRVIKA